MSFLDSEIACWALHIVAASFVGLTWRWCVAHRCKGHSDDPQGDDYATIFAMAITSFVCYAARIVNGYALAASFLLYLYLAFANSFMPVFTRID
jgi:hypothetical protein